MSKRYPGLYKRKGSKFWWWKGTINGVLVRISTGCTDQAAAWIFTEKWRRMKEEQLKYGPLAWSVFKFEYKSQGMVRISEDSQYNKMWSVDAFERATGITMMVDFTPETLQRAVDAWLTAGEWSDNTIDTHIANIKSVGRYAQRKRYIPVQDWGAVRRVSKVRTRQEHFTPEEAAEIIDRVKDTRLLHSFLMLLFWGNMRRGEAAHARWEWLDREKRDIIIQRDGEWAPKADTDSRIRRLPVCSQLWDFLMELEKTAKSPYIVTDEVGWRPSHDHSWSVRMVDLSAKLTKQLGREVHIYAHKFRHSIITGMDSDGANPAHIQQASRHKYYSTTQGYTHPSTDNARKVLQEFADRHWSEK